MKTVHVLIIAMGILFGMAIWNHIPNSNPTPPFYKLIYNTSTLETRSDDLGAYEYNLYIYDALPLIATTDVGIGVNLTWTNPTGAVTVEYLSIEN